MKIKNRRIRRLQGLICIALVFCCTYGLADETPSATAKLFQPLQSIEDRLIQSQPVTGSVYTPAAGQFGEDPYRIRYLSQIDRYLILLRNSSEVILCDGELNILDRRPTPRSPTAWDLVDDKWLFVGGEHASVIRTYRISSSKLEPRHALDIKDAVSIRDLVYVAKFDALFALDAFNRQLIQISLKPDWINKNTPAFGSECFPLGAGPLSILSVGDHLIINLLLEHHLLILPIAEGRPDFMAATKISNTGPFWCMDAFAEKDRLIIAAGGVEDRPLNRLGGEFGFVDSFLYLFHLNRSDDGTYRWNGNDGTDPQRSQAVNLSKHRIITPKAIRFQQISTGGISLWVTGFGGERFAEYRIYDTKPLLNGTWPISPGVTDFVIRWDKTAPTIAMVSPLLDRISVLGLETGRKIETRSLTLFDSAVASTNVRIGELLFFTTMLTPLNRIQGELSRFTCETCHFEGTIDGRTHFTGREDIHATSKTLYGLVNNVPLFSRAGSPSLAAMVMAEFEVANQERNDRFTIRSDQHPWLSDMDKVPAVLTPLYLRRCFLEFFALFAHRPNPWRLKVKRLDDGSKKGIEVFRRRCEDCHQAIKTTRRSSAVPGKDWETWLTEADRDLVWGAPFLCKTGIRPYPDPSGTRVPSLRRVWYKYPYFTNGSARNLRDVLVRFRYQGATAWHQYDGLEKDTPGIKALTNSEIEALESLLRYF